MGTHAGGRLHKNECFRFRKATAASPERPWLSWGGVWVAARRQHTVTAGNIAPAVRRMPPTINVTMADQRSRRARDQVSGRSGGPREQRSSDRRWLDVVGAQEALALAFWREQSRVDATCASSAVWMVSPAGREAQARRRELAGLCRCRACGQAVPMRYKAGVPEAVEPAALASQRPASWEGRRAITPGTVELLSK